MPCGPTSGRRGANSARLRSGRNGLADGRQRHGADRERDRADEAAPVEAARAGAAAGARRRCARRASPRSGSERPSPRGLRRPAERRARDRDLRPDVRDERADDDPRRPEVRDGEAELPRVPVREVREAGVEQEDRAGDERHEAEPLDRVRDVPRPAATRRASGRPSTASRAAAGSRRCPVATWTPCVTRYSHDGCAGIDRKPTSSGCCARCETRPVRKHVKKLTPSAMPSSAAVRSERRRARERALAKRRERSPTESRQANHRPSTSHDRRVTRQAGGRRRGRRSRPSPTCAQSNQSLTPSPALEADPRRGRSASPGGSSSTSTSPPGRSSRASRGEQRRRSPADADVAVEQQRRAPASRRPGCDRRRDACTTVAPRSRAIRTATGETSTPSARTPAPRERDDVAARARSRRRAPAPRRARGRPRRPPSAGPR